MVAKPKTKKKRRAKLTQEQKAHKRLEQTRKRKARSFKRKIANIFETAGFTSISTHDIHFEFKDHRTELDAIFTYQHIVIIAEDTCAGNTDTLKSHLLKKNVFYTVANKNKEEFIEFLDAKFPEFAGRRDPSFTPAQMKLIVLYCSYEKIDKKYKEHLSNVFCLELSHLEYFSRLSKAIGSSVKYELYKFLEISAEELASSAGQPLNQYEGFVLPETPSGFPNGYKIATLYIDPATLIALSYVMRRDGWSDSEGLYQRMISKNKIASMRRYLAQDGRVFINNVIVSLPSETKFIQNETGRTIDPNSVTSTTSVKVQLPNKFNLIGIIDGQHRVFAYHEGKDTLERQIAHKRLRQQLLVTGIIYPGEMSERKQLEFEAKLFLEINDKQTKTRPELRQAIESITNPFSGLSIARAIVNKLAGSGPLSSVLEAHPFDTGKLKSSSIVSFGVRPLVKVDGDDSLFKIWHHTEKTAFAEVVQEASKGGKKKRDSSVNLAVLDDYVDFCSNHLNIILSAYKKALPPSMWTTDKKISRALTATAINGIVVCLRELVRNGKTGTFDDYSKAFARFNFDMSPDSFKYKSSNWGAFGRAVYARCFEDKK